MAWAQGARGSGKSMHWELSGACLGRSDITSCDVIDAMAKNPEVSRGSQKKKSAEEKSGKRSRGENMARRKTRGCTERDGFPSPMRLDKQGLAQRAALASFLSHRSNRLRRKEKPRAAPVRALRSPSWHQQRVLMRLDWITQSHCHGNNLKAGTFQNTN